MMTTVLLTMDDPLTRRRRRRKEPSTTVAQGNEHVSSPNKPQRKQRRQRRRSSQDDDDDMPFWMLVLQVGATIFIICAFIATVARWMSPDENINDDYMDDGQFAAMEEVVVEKPKEASLPDWTLSASSRFDAYGISETYGSTGGFWDVAETMRNDFSKRYGGETAARAILERGMSTFAGESQKDIEHTACRIRDAKQNNRPFKFAFGGYSVTVGRGNFFSQSFPLVMERILRRPFQVLGVELQVRNAAIGGVPSFPYGWCMENFWGLDADVVSWDYAMNEAGGKREGLEAYVRHAEMLDRSPKLIVKDTHLAEARRNVLKAYAESGSAVDSVVLHTDPAATPFLAIPEEKRPYGFKDWRKFGAPPGAPGMALHHPAVKEHELNAWILSMHFLSALELVAADQDSSILRCESIAKKKNALPPPVTVNSANTTMDWFSILFGDVVENATSTSSTSKWTLNPVHCRTSFEPILQGDLDSLIVSGIYGNGTDIMRPKGAMYYSQGWVLDLSDEEKLAKRKLDRFDGLGYVDSKKAYYGIYASGPLQLFLPYEGTSAVKPKAGDEAQDWVRSIVFCEVNEKRPYGSCNAEKHISYTIGGVNATHTKMIDSAGTLYYGKKLCLYARVPPEAKLTTRGALIVGTIITSTNATTTDDTVGLSVVVSVKDMHIMKKDLACSLSHVIWEETKPTAS